MKLQNVGTLLLGLAILVFAGLSISQQRTIDTLRDQLRTERENEIKKMQDTLNALQLVEKYQNYLKEKGIALP